MEGKAYCVIHKQGLFTIDINGQMDEQATLNSDGIIKRLMSKQ